MVLSLWNEELRKDLIARAAQKADRAAGLPPRSVAEATRVLERPTSGATNKLRSAVGAARASSAGGKRDPASVAAMLRQSVASLPSSSPSASLRSSQRLSPTGGKALGRRHSAGAVISAVDTAEGRASLAAKLAARVNAISGEEVMVVPPIDGAEGSDVERLVPTATPGESTPLATAARDASRVPPECLLIPRFIGRRPALPPFTRQDRHPTAPPEEPPTPPPAPTPTPTPTPAPMPTTRRLPPHPRQRMAPRESHGTRDRPRVRPPALPLRRPPARSCTC